MMRLASILLLTVFPLLSSAAERLTALEALKTLPEDEAKNLARIEAHDGNPTPERWHILVYNSEAEAGLKEYVVASGKLSTLREVSQFAESLTAADVIGAKAVQMDSGKVAQLAKEYASVNKVVIATLNYQLSKQENVPVWRVTCFNKEGEILGTLMVSATKGTVLSHEGFSVEPKSGKRTNAKLRLKTEAQPMVAVAGEAAVEIQQEVTDEDDSVGEDATDDEQQIAETNSEVAVAENRPERVASSHSRSMQDRDSAQATAKNHRGSSGRTSYRSSVRPPNPVSAVKRVTSPVRHIVRRILPF